jgi:hypothetical protein
MSDHEDGSHTLAWQAAKRVNARRSEHEFAEFVIEVSSMIRECANAYQEPVPYFGAHDAAKRLYRMGYRLVAEPELATCSRCKKEGVITSQSLCIECVRNPNKER